MAQPKIDGTGRGKAVMPYGSDGTDWIALLVNALGRLQVDVITAALGSGAATEVTLLLIKGYVDALETLLAGGLPAALDSGALKIKEQSPLTGFATSTNQTTMITALQLIDDLRNALGSVNTDDLQVDVKTSALPTDAATQTTLALCLTALQKIDDLQNALATVATDRLLVASKSGDKIFGFESIVEGEAKNENLAATYDYATGTPVPTGKIWKITRVTVNYAGTGCTRVAVLVSGLAESINLIDQATPVTLVDYGWSGEIHLQAGDYMWVREWGAAAGNDLYCRYAGVQMNAP